MPRTTRPPMIGETPTTRPGPRAAPRGCRAPRGSGRSRPRGSRGRSARRPPRRSPRARRVRARPRRCRGSRSAPERSAARWRVHHSWKCIGAPDAVGGLGTVTIVSTSASVIGRSRAPSGQRRDIRSITCVGVSPSRSHPVRARCVPRSRSPSVNHGQPAPHSCSSRVHPLAVARATPAALGVVHAGERVDDRVDVGLQAHARQPQVVAGVDHDRERLGGCRGRGIRRRRAPRARRARTASRPRLRRARRRGSARRRRCAVPCVKARIRPRRAGG